MSSLLRAEAVAMRPGRVSRPASLAGRVIRGDAVGLHAPLALPVPPAHPHAGGESDAALDDLALAPPDPSLAEEREAARVQGYNEGFLEGVAAGQATAEQAASLELARLRSLVRGVREQHATFFRAAERQVVDLALQIAQKVVEREVENMPDLAVHVIRAALEEMDARTAVRVRVSPDDEELLRRRWSQVVPPGVSPEQVELQPDERVQAGGAIVETTQGQVDAQLETKLAQLGNALWTFVTDTTPEPEADDALAA